MGVQSELSVVCWNMRGFKSSVPYVRKLIKENDIVMLSEHWLHANRLHLFEENFNGIDYFARSSKFAGADTYGQSRGQGGVAVLWKGSLGGVVPLNDIDHDRFCGIRLQTDKGVCLKLFSVYMPAMGSGEDLSCTLDELAGVLETAEPDDRIILGGDFNGDVGHARGTRGTRPPTIRGSKVIDMTNEYNLEITNLQEEALGPVDTYYGPIGSSCIDYFMTPKEINSTITECRVLEEDVLNTSDHLPIRLVLNLKLIPSASSVGHFNKSIKWGKLSPERILELYTIPLQDKLTDLDSSLNRAEFSKDLIDEKVGDLVKVIHTAAEALPRSNYRKHVKPYWSERLNVLKKDKILHYKIWKDSNRPRNKDNLLYQRYKESKKAFSREIKELARRYENDQMVEIMKSAEVDKFHFWKRLKKVRGDKSTRVLAIKAADGVVKHEVHDVLKVWREHFLKIGTPKEDKRYDDHHFHMVNEFVLHKMGLNDLDQFSHHNFDTDEVKKAIRKLNKGKAPGPDLVTSEHLLYGGKMLLSCLTKLFNMMLKLEYIPVSFRRGTQVPLYKGKNACSLNPSNYRGITLLSTLNKVYEIIIWQRMEHWWTSNNTICGLQGAGKKGFSCLHSSLMLQETLATSNENNKKCFSVYFDVAKAYDTIWINGLFYQLFKLGITGKTWRMLRKCYDNFMCRVRVMGHFSEWYELTCGIHQGGFLSLIKYVAFTNSLLVEIRDSGLCCQIYRTPSVPVGYADDMAAACPSKYKLDRVIDKAYKHGCTWRYEFNASKSAVLILGETRRERAANKKHREFKLGGKKVLEKDQYEHLGVVSTVSNEDDSRVKGRLSKARKVLNVATGIGIKKKGLNMNTCNVIFWCIVVPTALFGCEIWCLTANDIACIEEFQVYAGKRMQRLHPRAPNICSFTGLGWMHLEIITLVRKVLFIRTILTIKEDELVRVIFCLRVQKFCENPNKAVQNEGRSPVFEMLHAALRLNMLEMVISYAEGTRVWSKKQWSKTTWEYGWRVNDTRNALMLSRHKELDLFCLLHDKVSYVSWWSIADIYPRYIYFCETMVTILSHASKLKNDNVLLKARPRSERVCINCHLSQVDNARHMIMECNDTQDERNYMFDEIYGILGDEAHLMRNTHDVFPILLGRKIIGMSDEGMINTWIVAGTHVHKMYQRRVRLEEGIG